MAASGVNRWKWSDIGSTPMLRHLEEHAQTTSNLPSTAAASCGAEAAKVGQHAARLKQQGKHALKPHSSSKPTGTNSPPNIYSRNLSPAVSFYPSSQHCAQGDPFNTPGAQLRAVSPSVARACVTLPGFCSPPRVHSPEGMTQGGPPSHQTKSHRMQEGVHSVLPTTGKNHA